MNSICEYINNWQKENDTEFKPIPTDLHAKLVLNNLNVIVTFIFSTKNKMHECINSINDDILNFDYILEQEDGLTYYWFNKEKM